MSLFFFLFLFFACFGRKLDGDSWCTWWFNDLPGPSIAPNRTPMFGWLPFDDRWLPRALVKDPLASIWAVKMFKQPKLSRL